MELLNYLTSNLSSAEVFASLFPPPEWDVKILAMSQRNLQFRALFLPQWSLSNPLSSAQQEGDYFVTRLLKDDLLVYIWKGKSSWIFDFIDNSSCFSMWGASGQNDAAFYSFPEQGGSTLMLISQTELTGPIVLPCSHGRETQMLYSF